MKSLLTICSSRRRPQKLMNMVNSYFNTIRGDNNKLVIYVSETDPNISEYKQLNAPIEFGKEKSMVEVLNFFVKKYPDYDFYSEINDDHQYVTSGWDVEMMSAIDRKNCGFSIAYGRTDNLPTATMHGGRLIRHLGYFFPPEYKHSAVDLWLMELCNSCGLLTYTPNVIIDHLHPAFGKGEKDQNHLDVESDYTNGQAVFDKWKKERAKADCDRLDRVIESVRIVSNPKDAPACTEGVSVVMNTCDRPIELQLTVDSYLSIKHRPKQLYVFDDCSQYFDKVKEIVMLIPEAILIKGSERLGCHGRSASSLIEMKKLGAKNILNLDSDCIFADTWWGKTCDMVKRHGTENNVFSLFNSSTHKSKPFKDSLVEKDTVGGLGMLMGVALVSKIIEPYRYDKNGNWDCHTSKAAKDLGYNLYACSPSMIQHIGTIRGTHACSAEVAIDFYGDKPTIPTADYQPDEYIIELHKKYRLPIDFGPKHPSFNQPSFQHKYLKMIKREPL